MNKVKVTKKQKDEVTSYIKKWKGILFLSAWCVDVRYHEDSTSEYIIINMSPEYMNAVIDIHMSFFDEPEAYRREEIICHELCHIVVQPLIQIAADAACGNLLSQREIDWNKELVTQHITRSIFWKS